MKIEHIAIWTHQLDVIKNYYIDWFQGIAGPKYTNALKHYESYFISFQGEARIEIMQRPDIPVNLNDSGLHQYTGFTHLAFETESMEAVNYMAEKMQNAGLPVLDGPRRTGDGYYEFVTTDPDGNRIEVTSSCLSV